MIECEWKYYWVNFHYLIYRVNVRRLLLNYESLVYFVYQLLELRNWEITMNRMASVLNKLVTAVVALGAADDGAGVGFDFLVSPHMIISISNGTEPFLAVAAEVRLLASMLAHMHYEVRLIFCRVCAGLVCDGVYPFAVPNLFYLFIWGTRQLISQYL